MRSVRRCGLASWGMQADVLATLVRRRPEIRQAWEVLLRTERASTPMANPDTLVYMMDLTLDEILKVLHEVKTPPGARGEQPECPCGLNPMLVYFAAMRQVLTEALVLAQAALPSQSPRQRETDLALLTHAADQVSGREVVAFCSLCQRRSSAGGAVNALAVSGGRLTCDAAEDAIELGE